jgi:hypothetical protein
VGAVLRALGMVFSSRRVWRCVVDPVTLVLAALAAGVASGAGETASQVVKDGYEGLKGLLVRRFAGNARAEQALADHEVDPERYEKPLAKQLSETGAAEDPEVRAAAEELVTAAKEAGVTTKYQVTISGGKVGIVGDYGTVTMN